MLPCTNTRANTCTHPWPVSHRWNYYKDRLHTLMTDASSSVWALVVSNVMVITILVSTTRSGPGARGRWL